MSSPEGGSYVIVLTLTRDQEGRDSDQAAHSHLWNLVSPRSNLLLRGSESETGSTTLPTEPSSQAKPTYITSVTEALKGKWLASKEIDDNRVTSDSFSNWTRGNTVDVLIDGLETFERMFEVRFPGKK